MATATGPTLAPALWGIPVVQSTTERAALFPVPAVNQRVQDLQTGAFERWDGTKWLTDTTTPSINPRNYGAVGDATTSDRVAILAAEVAAAAAGVPIKFTAGVYLFDGAAHIFSVPVEFAVGAIISVVSGTDIYLPNVPTTLAQVFIATNAGDASKGHVYMNIVQTAVVYPQWWGAKGDGVTDDTKPVQAAVDASAYNSSHTGVPVDLLPGNYLLGSLNLVGSGGIGQGVWLRGAGRYATRITTTAANVTVIQMDGAGCKLTDLQLVTAVGTTPVAGQVMIHSKTGNACRVQRVDVYKYYVGAAISGVHLEDVVFDYGVASGTGVDLSDSIGSILTDVGVRARYNQSECFLLKGVTRTPDTNQFTRCSTGAGTPDLWATYGTPNTGVAGIATSVRMAVQVGGFPPRWTRFTDCPFETAINSIGVFTFDYQAGQDTKITGGYIYGGYRTFAMTGATAAYLNDHVLTSTIVFGGYINGVYHNPADTTNYAPLVLQNCSVVDNSQNAAGGWPGVQLGANSRGFTMRGGSCGTTVGQPVLQQFGVAIDAAAKDYFIDVDTIDFTGNTAGNTSGLVTTLASATNMTPLGQTSFVSGTTAITNILLPERLREWRVIPTGLFTWGATGNIALAGSAVVGKLLIFRYVQDTGKWYPSYTA